MADPRTLRAFPFLQQLGARELAQLATQAVEVTYPAHTVLFRDQNSGDKFYLLKTGVVEIFKPTTAGEVILSRLQPGDHFGEMSLLDDAPRSAGARASNTVTVIEIAKPVFLALVSQHPALFAYAARVSSERLRRGDLHLIEELTAHYQQLQKLYDTSLDISRRLELNAALSAITQRAVELLNARTGQIRLIDQNPRARQVRPTQQALSVPIQLDTQPHGTLTVYRAHRAAAFTPHDTQLLQLLANQAAIAIENARLFAVALEKSRLDGELKVARELQRSLIPTRAPDIAEFELASFWEPARQVSGDFYDFIQLPNGRWGIIIADVCGKGMPAALFMALCRSVLRANLLATDNLSNALTRANQLIVADASDGLFVTAFVGVLDPQTRCIEYINAGHSAPLWWRTVNARLTNLTHTTSALGMNPNAPCTTRTITLAKGDTLLLYTDGITEAKNARRAFFGDKRLAKTFRAVATTTPPTILLAIEQAVHAFTGNVPCADDETMVALRAKE